MMGFLMNDSAYINFLYILDDEDRVMIILASVLIISLVLNVTAAICWFVYKENIR